MPSCSLKKLQNKMQALFCASPLQPLNHPLLIKHNIKMFVKRDDLIHRHISGNKWRKLKFNLQDACKRDVNHIVSFGGAYSNHIHALAAAGFYFGFQTTGVIRGEDFYRNNPTLKQAQKWGMNLHFVDRKTYRLRYNKEYLKTLETQYPDAIIVPEGGTNLAALQGVKEIATEILSQADFNIDHIFTATGSGGTLAGLISSFSQQTSPQTKKTKITGIAVLKQADYLKNEISNLLVEDKVSNPISWQLKTEYHLGGYAKVSSEHSQFCHEFEQQTGIPIEPIYTGKMFAAIFNLIEKGEIKTGANIIALHTGGLQGLQGLIKK
jgi:1-aminocyclopropane-1-carboxylate deaminase